VGGRHQANPKAVLSAMFAEYRQAAEAEAEAEAQLSQVESADTGADFALKLIQAVTQQINNNNGGGPKASTNRRKVSPIPQPQLTVDDVYTVTLWGASVNVYAASGLSSFLLIVSRPHTHTHTPHTHTTHTTRHTRHTHRTCGHASLTRSCSGEQDTAVPRERDFECGQRRDRRETHGLRSQH
jgi:hypothetical protein